MVKCKYVYCLHSDRTIPRGEAKELGVTQSDGIIWYYWLHSDCRAEVMAWIQKGGNEVQEHLDRSA